jgi:hypothetical protein
MATRSERTQASQQQCSSQERRQAQRYQVEEGVVAVWRAEGAKIGAVINVSSLGMAFSYISDGKPEKDAPEIDIFIQGTGILIQGLPVNTVSDVVMENAASFSLLSLRRRSVSFKALSSEQQRALQIFISQQQRNKDGDARDQPFKEGSQDLTRT